jgi:tRNA A-37 threonylcarbamoyl transferase component Bud32
MTQPLPGAPPVREGEILAGKYRVERVLGQGGMGVVVAAMHLQLEKRVALKFVLPDHVQSPETVERFAREARAASKLQSEHVARVLDVGTLENGSPYMVMEYLEGRDLGQEVDTRGPLPFAEAAEYVLQACEAIAEAHALGIVHRDLKPQNLFLARRVDGRPLVKVLDFGISKFNGAQSGENMSLTKTHAVMGSPNYMSPEQLRSARAVDQRTDIWALGVILYELLTAKVPFVATSVTELCAMVLQDTPPPLAHVRPDVPLQLADVVSKCLEKDPNQRFQSIASLAHALEGYALSSQSGAGQRILAVARESSARGLGSGPPPPNAISSQQVPVAGAFAGGGRTSVSWAATELQQPKKRGVALYVALGSVAALALFAVLALVAWRVVLPKYRTAAAAPQGSSSAQVAAEKPSGTTAAQAPTSPASTATPAAPAGASVDAATPSIAATPPASATGKKPGTTQHPALPNGGKPRKNPNDDAPDERD